MPFAVVIRAFFLRPLRGSSAHYNKLRTQKTGLECLKNTVYSEKLLDHFQNPRNVGELEPPAVTVEVSNPICGDILRLSALVTDGRIKTIRYQTRGCTASIAAGSALTELLEGKTAAEITGTRATDVEAALGGLPNESKHAAVLAVDGAKALAKKLESS